MTKQELTPGTAGTWCVTTASGSRHVIDLDHRTYRRLAGDVELGAGLDDGASTLELVDVLQHPRLNSRFSVVLHDGPGELDLTSGYVTHIARLGPGDRPELVHLTAIEQVATAPPTNAWLLIGDDASFPDEQELLAQREPSDPAVVEWTCPKQIQRGDLVLVYYVAPRSAACFVARAVLPPIFDSAATVNADREVDPHQWWTDLTPLVPIPPIPFARLRELSDGHLNLRGKPSHYLASSIIESLRADIGELDSEQALVLQVPTGDPDLPDPGWASLETLRTIASGRLINERLVELHIVEPLLNLLLDRHASTSWCRQHKGPGGIADYAVCAGDRLTSVIEVKLGIRHDASGGVHGSPDLSQLVRYMQADGVPGALIDANEIVLVDADSYEPHPPIERTQLGERDLGRIAAHLGLINVGGPA